MQSAPYLLLAIFLIGTVIAIICDFALPKRVVKAIKLDLAEQKAADDARIAEETKRKAADCEAARRNLREFYAKNQQFLAKGFPPQQLEAVIREQMSDNSDPAKVWGVCKSTIERLKPILEAGKLEHAQLLLLDEKIEQGKQRLVGLNVAATKLSDEEGVIEDARHGQEEELQRLQSQKKHQTFLTKAI